MTDSSARLSEEARALRAFLRPRGEAEAHRLLGRLIVSPDRERRSAALEVLQAMRRESEDFAEVAAPAVAQGAWERLHQTGGERASRLMAAALWELTDKRQLVVPEVVHALRAPRRPSLARIARAEPVPREGLSGRQLTAGAVGAGLLAIGLLQSGGDETPAAPAARLPSLMRPTERREIRLHGQILEIRAERRELLMMDDATRQSATVRLPEPAPEDVRPGRKALVEGTSDTLGAFGMPIVTATSVVWDSPGEGWGFKTTPGFGPRKSGASIESGRELRPLRTP